MLPLCSAVTTDTAASTEIYVSPIWLCSRVNGKWPKKKKDAEVSTYPPQNKQGARNGSHEFLRIQSR